MNVNVKIINKSKWPLPKYETSGASGMDVRANLVDGVPLNIHPAQTVLIPTGLFLEIPEGYEIQVRPRSGLSLKTKLRIANSPGTIDSCYRGELCIIMNNTETELDYENRCVFDFVSPDRGITINDGDRIAQIVLCEVPKIEWEEVDQLSNTDRGTGGFGSTGK